MRAAVLALAVCSAYGGEPANVLSPQERGEGYVLLFNGRDLEGWEGDRRFWKVDDGAIVGSTDEQAAGENTFLIYTRPFADFHLKADVRLRNHNSGIQFRSRVLPGPGHVVTGYQADFSDAGERSAWGNFYEEKGRGRGVMKTPDEGWQKGKSLVRPKEWNSLEVLAQGNRIQIKLNGAVTIETTDDLAASGIIAIQLHKGEKMRVECRNLDQGASVKARVIDFDAIPGVACPCGTARRAFSDTEEVPFTLHRTDISVDAQTHYHKRITETYYFLDCGPEAKMELDGEHVPVSPGMCIQIPPGVRHRAIGKMQVLIIAYPKFDPEDEFLAP
jgi:mannose-6-phosphate isomerase-like protein (cupin superfamily)